jgi:hypothetical protein
LIKKKRTHSLIPVHKYWIQNVELRARVQIGFEQGEAKNALARAVFLNRLGEIRDRSFENQRGYTSSGSTSHLMGIGVQATYYFESLAGTGILPLLHRSAEGIQLIRS